MNDMIETVEEDRWERFRYFLGDWAGTGTGKPGNSTVERSYRLALASQFIEIRSRSVYAPQKVNPTGEDHQEIAFLSFDKERSCYVLREFLVEGYVNQYVLQSSEIAGATIEFITETIENFPAGWRARTTLEILSEDSFQETFDLAGPAAGWSCYITNVLHRVS